MAPDELVELGTEIVREAASRTMVMRLIGGAAVYARCPSISTHPKLQRPYKDLDLVASRSGWSGLTDLFSSLGFETESVTPSRATFSRSGLTVDVRVTSYRDFYSFDFATRLSLDETTLSPADLLLLKLQRFAFAEKDIQDSTALLLDHRVSNAGEEDTIDRDYLYGLTNRDWGLWTTVFDNTVALEKILDKYLDPEEAQLVWRRIELIQEVMDSKGKSLGWWLRGIPNKSLKWYRVPSE